MNSAELQAKVETKLEAIGVQAEDARTGDDGQWMLLRNETPIYIDAWEDRESTPWNYFVFQQDPSVFQITVPFCYGPTLKRAELLEELLVVNLNLLNAKFSYNSNDNVVVLSCRVSGTGLDALDLAQTIDGLCYYSEMAYHVLKDEFNLKRVVSSDAV
jgi:hypothetical protein